MSAVPSGLCDAVSNPALKRRAIVGSPSGRAKSLIHLPVQFLFFFPLRRSLYCAPMFKTQDLHVREIVRLASPRAIKELFPAMPEATATVVQSRERITRILRQEDPRLLVVVGPCSMR